VDAYTVLGIAFLQSDQYPEAKTNFEKGVQKADIFLKQAYRVETIDFKALALCGLAVCKHDKTNADKATETFLQARTITKAKGKVNSVLKFFDLIADLDDKELLIGLRQIAAGKNDQ